MEKRRDESCQLLVLSCRNDKGRAGGGEVKLLQPAGTGEVFVECEAEAVTGPECGEQVCKLALFQLQKSIGYIFLILLGNQSRVPKG